MIRPPAPHPCGSCPYRRDVPSGVWSEGEYEKLPGYDRELAFQPPAVFMCHQADGRLCAGWTGCHDMTENLGLRLAVLIDSISDDDFDAILDYTTTTPLFSSGTEAFEHGMADLETPSLDARMVVDKLIKKGKAI